MDLNELTIVQARTKLDSKEITATELTQACLDRINKVNDQLKACLTICDKKALEQASEADKRLQKGESGPVLGIPFLAKDNMMSKGVRTTAGSKILEDYIAPYNATILEKLEKAGAILLGKTNLDEFAHGSSTENSAFGPTLNPWDTSRVPGGSSGGSAAALIADFCLFSLGSDTGGSIRQPASFCSVTGFKPSYGRVSRHGLIAMTSSTDVIGPFTKTIEDSAIVLKEIAGVDRFDATTSTEPVGDYVKSLKGDIKGMKIGWPREYFPKDLFREGRELIKQAKQVFIDLGAEIIDISLPYTKYGIPVYYILTPAEVSSNLARLDGLRFGFSAEKATDFRDQYLKTRGQGFGPEAKRRIMIGTYALSSGYYDAYYLKAQKVRTLITDDFSTAFKEVDIIMGPVAPTPAFKLGEKTTPLEMYMEDKFLSGAALAGLPAVSVPAGFIDGLPFGLQLIAPKLKEETIFKLASNFQSKTDWHLVKPKILI